MSPPEQGSFIVLKPTDHLVERKGVPMRQWIGETAGGVHFTAFMAWFRVDARHAEAFEREFPELVELQPDPDNPLVPAIPSLRDILS